jgi:hypothetical protein
VSHVKLRLAFGAGAKTWAKRKSKRIGPAVAIKLNRAGRKVVSRRGTVRVRVVTTLSVGAPTGTTTKTTKLGARQAGRRRGGRIARPARE